MGIGGTRQMKKPRRFHIEALLVLGFLASLTAGDTDAPARTGPLCYC